MDVAKITISIEAKLLKKIDLLVKERVFQDRSQLFQIAVSEKISRFRRGRSFVSAQSWMQKKNKHWQIWVWFLLETHAKAWTLNKMKECDLFGRPHSVGIS